MRKAREAEGTGGPRTSPDEGRFSRPPHRDGTGLAKLVYELALLCEGFCDAGPDSRRVGLRDFRAQMRQMFVGLSPNASEIAQAMAEEDGDPNEDTI